MHHKLLLVAVIREMARLTAAIATYKGARASLAHLDVHLFGALADSLQHYGVGRRVSADMLGMVRRAFLRKVSRAKASVTDRGRSLWEAVYEYVAEQREVSVAQIEQRFARDDAEALQGVLADMRESGVLRVQGRSKGTVYRLPSGAEVEADLEHRDNATDLVWTLIHHGAATREELLARGVRPEELEKALTELLENARVEVALVDKSEHFRSARYSIPSGSALEGAVLDHVHAAVTTLVTVITQPTAVAGASTYQLDVWPEHPLYDETRQLYRYMRERVSALRARIDDHNATLQNAPPAHKLNLYMGLSTEDNSLK